MSAGCVEDQVQLCLGVIMVGDRCTKLIARGGLPLLVLGAKECVGRDTEFGEGVGWHGPPLQLRLIATELVERK